MPKAKATKVPLDWIKTLDPKLLALDEVPLFGYPPEFPWEEFAEKLAQSFDIESLSIKPSPPKWRPEKDLFKGISEPLVPFPISISSIEGQTTWLFSEGDLPFLLSALITKDPNTKLDSIDHDLQEGFFNFLALEALQAFNAMEFDKTLTPHLLPERSLPSGDCLCIDVAIQLYKQTVTGRLAIPQKFLKSWKERYAEATVTTSLPDSIAEQFSIPIDLEIGQTSVTIETWTHLNEGDFLLLDHCGIEPGKGTGTVILSVRGTPLYQGAFSNGKLTISESPPYQEVEASMDDETNEEEFPTEEEFGETTFEDTLEEDDLGLGLEETFEEESIIEETSEEETELPTEEVAEETGENQLTEEAPVEAAPTEEKAIEKSIHPVSSKKQTPVKKEKLPISIRIEVGRIEMPVKQLLDLKPGNLLELDVTPEEGVNLVVNGKLVGKGELLQVGETLGVRVLDLGTK